MVNGIYGANGVNARLHAAEEFNQEIVNVFSPNSVEIHVMGHQWTPSHVTKTSIVRLRDFGLNGDSGLHAPLHVMVDLEIVKESATNHNLMEHLALDQMINQSTVIMI